MSSFSEFPYMVIVISHKETGETLVLVASSYICMLAMPMHVFLSFVIFTFKYLALYCRVVGIQLVAQHDT